MDIFSIFTLLGGLAFFLYGINLLSVSLENIAGGKLEKILGKMTSHPLRGLLLGAGVTAAIQSSSAVTVMLVGLVNSGMMKLSQAIGVVMGSNIGTTVTAWILSLSGIQSDNFFVRFLKPESFSPILALIGVILLMSAQTNRKKNIGGVLIGFAILMFGMATMSSSMRPLADMPQFSHFLTAFSNPILGVLAGTIVTAIIQSSSASVGILQAMSMASSINYAIAIPIIMGQNIGTCISALLSSIGVNTNAKRVAVVHIIFNVIGVVICLSVFEILNLIFNFGFIKTNVSPFGIAVVHSIFNIITTLILFPFTKLLENLAIKIVKDDNNNEVVLIDERILKVPSFAVGECFSHTLKMANITEYNLRNSTLLLSNYNKKEAEKIRENENLIDNYDDKLNSFLLKIASKELSEEDNIQVSRMLSAISDLERIGDHSKHILKIAKELSDEKNKLSSEAQNELNIFIEAILEMYDTTIASFEDGDVESAKEIDAIEDVIKQLTRKIKNNYIQRLKEGICTSETGFIFMDLINNLRRIAAHCGNIATNTLQLKDSTIEKHKYNHRVKDEDKEFSSKYVVYKNKYDIKKVN